MSLLSFSVFFFFNDTATTEIYTLSLHDALPIYRACDALPGVLHRHAPHRARLLRNALRAARRPRTAPARGGADRALRAPGGGADPLRALRLALVAQALEAEALALPAPIKSRPAHARAARGCACQLFTAPAVIHART